MVTQGLSDMRKCFLQRLKFIGENIKTSSKKNELKKGFNDPSQKCVPYLYHQFYFAYSLKTELKSPHRHNHYHNGRHRVC